MIDERDRFVKERSERWRTAEDLLARSVLTAEQWSDLAGAHRDLCADLARARTLDVADDVARYLEALAGRAHHRLYDARSSAAGSLLVDLWVGFPRAFRRGWPFMLAAHALFYVPFLVGVIAPFFDDDFARSVVGADGIASAEASYADAPERTSGQDSAMAGFYVWNNVGIAFRCFATGAIFGLGSVFYLIYNGLVIGSVAGHLASVGSGWNLLSFIVGHGPWELTGIVVAGGAGLRLGWSLVDTGGRTRIGSLRAAGPDLVRLMLGATALLLIAAAIEGFWSAGPAPLWLKVSLGTWGASAIVAWLVAVGRR